MPDSAPAGELPAVGSLVDSQARKRRFKDRFLDAVARWQEGCLYCGAPAEIRALPRSADALQLPLCDRHLRWAMAARRERYGKQAHILRGYLLAWCRLRGGDRNSAVVWLDGHDLGRCE